MSEEAPTWEEATTCPRCGKPGKHERTNPIGRRGSLHTIRCLTPGCKWENTTWTVQTRPDGSIPKPDTRPRITTVPQVSQADAEAMAAILQRQHEASMRPNGEIRGR